MKNNNLLLFAGIIIIIGIILLIFKQTSSNINQSKTNGKLQVTASFYPLWYFAQQIGGDKADVWNITPAGAEPHDYDPSTQDIARIENGNILILNGGLEPWGNKINSSLTGKKVIVVIAGQDLLSQKSSENGKTLRDPHVWLDPVLAKREVEKITQGFITADPSNVQYYENNQMQLENKLDQLDSQFKLGLSDCKRKDFITAHTAFSYLAQQYGLKQVAIAGLSPDAEPSAQELAQVVNFAREEQIKYIFFEKLVSPKLSETIANEAGAQILVLDPLEGLDNNDIKSGKNYFTVMRENLSHLQTALSCKI